MGISDLIPTKHNLVGYPPFKRLTVVSRGPDYINPKNGAHRPRWWCQCSCGNPQLKLVAQHVLISGHIQSCGCLAQEQRRQWKNQGFHNRQAKKERKADTHVDGPFYVCNGESEAL